MARMMSDRDRATMLASLIDQMQPTNAKPTGKQLRIRARQIESGEDPDAVDNPNDIRARKSQFNRLDGPGRSPLDSDTYDDTQQQGDAFTEGPKQTHAPTARGPYPSTTGYHHEPYPGLLDIRNYLDEHEADEDRRVKYPTPTFDGSEDPGYVQERENYNSRKHELNPADQQGPPAPNTPEQMGYEQIGSNEPTIAVPASLANAGMAALMQQASGNAVAKSMGGDGQGYTQLAQNDGVDPEMLRKMQFLNGPTETSTDGGWQNDRFYHGGRAGAQREGAVAGGMANSNKKARRPE